MKSGLILAGEPMGLLIAQSEGSLDSVSGYDLAVAGAEFNVAVGVARLGHRVTYMTKLGKVKKISCQKQNILAGYLYFRYI